jgi:hypothetical protein
MNLKPPGAIRRLSRLPLVGPAIKESYRKFWYRRFIRNYHKVNEEAGLLLQQNGSKPTTVQERVICDLKATGIAFAEIGELLSEADAPLWTNLQQAIGEWLEKPTQRRDPSAKRVWKDYIIRYYGNGANIPLGCPLLSLGLSNSILNVVHGYLGVWAKLNYIDVWNTVPEPQDAKAPSASQRWHRDPEDIKLCKIFLYHTDVDDGAGPLHYLPNARPGERYGDLWPQELPAGSVATDSELEAKAPRSDWRICHGKKGTIVFVDTVGFHMGGRATLRNRVLSHWTFTTPGSHWPRASFFDPPVVQSFKSPAARWALECGRAR